MWRYKRADRWTGGGMGLLPDGRWSHQRCYFEAKRREKHDADPDVQRFREELARRMERGDPKLEEALARARARKPLGRMGGHLTLGMRLRHSDEDDFYVYPPGAALP